MKKNKGFTLIELMVVMGIIGVLGALIVPSVLGRADEARVSAAKNDLKALSGALKMYKLDNQQYPTSEQGLEALVKKPTSNPVPNAWKPYIEKLPKDPGGNEYKYVNPGVQQEVDIVSLGADGQVGGSGTAKDLGSWE